MNMPITELIQKLQEAHSALGNHPNVTVRFGASGLLDEEGERPISDVDIYALAQLVVIRG